MLVIGVSLCLLVIPLITATSFVYRFFFQQMEERTITEATNLVDQIGLNVENQMIVIDQFLANLSMDEQIQALTVLEDQDIAGSEYFDIYQKIEQQISFSAAPQLFKNLIVFGENGKRFGYNNVVYLSMDDLRATGWYQQTIQNGTKTFWFKPDMYPVNNVAQNMVLASHAVLHTEQLAFTGVIAVFIQPDDFQNMLAELDNTKQVYLVDDSRNVITANNASQADAKMFEDLLAEENFSFGSTLELPDDRVLITSSPNSFGWRVCMVASNEEILRDVNQTKYLLMGIFVCLLLVYLLFVAFLFNSVIHPLKYVINLLNDAESGNLSVQLHEKFRPDKLSITTGILSLIDRNVTVAKSLDDSVREGRKAELFKLQAQVNPHFIYNTLTSIKYIAMMNGQERISELITSFVKLLKNSINREGMFLTLDEELQNLRHYIRIQQLIYETGIEVSFEIPQETQCCIVPNFILQPLVENSILHGLAPKNHEGKILISSRLDQRMLVLTVQDNGVGMTPEVLKKVTESISNKEGFTGIGLSGIHERLRLLYGEPFGLTVESSDGSGTRMILKLPADNQPKQAEVNPG